MDLRAFRLRRASRGIESDSALVDRTLFALVGSLLLYGLAEARFDLRAILAGMGTIISLPDILINDYFARGGRGAAFVNAGLCALAGLGLVKRSGALVSGPAIAGVFTLAGFSLFGKNVYNIWPVVAGIALHARLSGRPFKEIVIVALFGTSLAPVVSEFTFSMGLAFPLNVLAGAAAGLAVGVVLPPIARNALDFTRGYNLYNVGFAAGFVGTLTMSALRALEIETSGAFAWAESGPGGLAPFLALYFAAMVVAGIAEDARWLEGLRRILASGGRLVSDFPRSCGIGATLVNMGLCGFLGMAYVFATGGDWNGPVTGGILTLVGFAAFGKHPLNALPPMLGVAAAAGLSSYGLAAPTSQLAGLFVTTLAPVSGAYGPLAGFAAGALHLLIVVNVGFLHGGLNLYNNGFSGGMTAGILVPVLEWLKERRNREA